jgi:ATP-dependent exoDNAse (exonuclease V) beta subunit
MALRGDVEDLIARLEKANVSSSPDILLTTAHKSKGLEYDNVVIANDFKFGTKEVLEMPEQELNLLYVACTRAKKNLQLPTILSLELGV